MNRTTSICLICVTALCTAVPVLAGDDAPDTLVLCSGQRLTGRIMEAQGATVQFRIGTEAYTFERAGVCEVISGNRPVWDPAWVAFVSDLAPRLAHEDERLAAAARAALAALGDHGRPYLKAAARSTPRGDVREALLRLSHRHCETAHTGRAAMLDRQVDWARRALGLTTDQEPGFRTALTAFFQDLRSTSDRHAARARYRKALADVFTEDQMAKYEDAMKEFRKR